MSFRILKLRGGYIAGPGGAPFTIEASDIVLPAGEVSVLEGGNGSGKSTFLKLLSRHPEVVAEQVETAPAHGVRVFYGAQRRHEALFGSLRVDECLFVASIASMGGTLSLRMPPRGPDLLGLVPTVLRDALAGVMQNRAAELSGGQRGLLVLAMTLIARPSDVLLLDEPDAGADEKNRHAIARALASWAREKSIPVLVATHHQGYLALFQGARLRAANGRVFVRVEEP